MGGGGSQKSDSQQGPASLNPVAGLFAQLFGFPTQTGPGGGITIGGGSFPELAGGSAGIPDGTFDILGTLFGQTDAPDIGTSLGAGFFGNLFADASSAAQQGSGFVADSLIPAAGELAATGFRTDIQPAVDLSSYLFQNEFLPNAQEQFGSKFGLGPGDSDFNAAVVREGGRRSNELGALQVQLDEAAALRRAGGLNTAANILGGGPGIIGQSVAGLSGLDTASDLALRLGGEGGALFQFLQQMLGQNFTEGTSGQTDSRSFNLSIL